MGGSPDVPEPDIRVAGPDDVATVVGLVRDALAEQSAMRGGDVWVRREAPGEPLEAWVGARIHDPDGALWLASWEHAPAGYAAVHTEQLADGAVLGVIDGVWVVPGLRGIGVGEALMDTVVRWCDDRDVWGIDGHALPGDRSTKNFFERFGFSARLLIVHRRRIGTPSGPVADPRRRSRPSASGGPVGD